MPVKKCYRYYTQNTATTDNVLTFGMTWRVGMHPDKSKILTRQEHQEGGWGEGKKA